MIQGQRRPDMTARIKPLPTCTGCTGSGVEDGLFGKRVCSACHGAGMTTATGEPLPLEEALLQLRLRLNQAPAALSPVGASEPAYYSQNERGPGRSTYAGD